MASKPERDLLREIEVGAKEVREAGTDLSNRIKAFEDWLNKVPGRVQAECELYSTDDGIESTYLTLDKDGKAWALFVYDYHHGYDEGRNRALLRDSSLDIKVTAVASFPKLLAAMADAQRFLVERLKKTTTEYDAFARSIGIEEGA